MFGEMEILQEKIREARHNELIGYSWLALGLAVAFAGLFFAASRSYAPMALAITLLGLLMTILGSVFAIYSATNRSQIMKGLDMTLCPKCGNKLEAETKYCPYCGTQIVYPHATQASVQPALTICGN